MPSNVWGAKEKHQEKLPAQLTKGVVVVVVVFRIASSLPRGSPLQAHASDRRNGNILY